MQRVDPVTLERAPVRLVPLGLEHEEGLRRAAADGELWNLRVTSVPEPGQTLVWGYRITAVTDDFALHPGGAAQNTWQTSPRALGSFYSFQIRGGASQWAARH